MKKLPFNNKNACLITDDLTGKYLTGLSLDEGYLIVADSLTLFVDARYYSQSKENFEKVNVNTKLFSSLNDVKNFLTEIGTENLYLDFSKTTVKNFNSYETFGFNILDAEDILSKSRSVKSQQEIDSIIKACEIAQNAYHHAIGCARVGISEIELKHLIEKSIIEFGGEGASFDIIVAFGKNGAVPHHKTGETKLTIDTPILVDMGAVYNGYKSDITRMAYFGTPTHKFLTCYKCVLTANEKAICEIECGMDTNLADRIARDSLKQEGLDKYFTHSLGHGIGLEIHEFPTLSLKRKDALLENMVFTIEPGVYIDGEFGIRIEDTVLLTKDGVKRLFTDSKELLILPIN